MHRELLSVGKRRLGTHGVAAMDGKLFTLFISAILISEIRKRMVGLKEEWTLSKIRTVLDKITFSKVKVEHLKKTKDLRGIVSARQRTYLAKLLGCPEKEAVQSENFEHKIRHFETKSGYFEHFLPCLTVNSFV